MKLSFVERTERYEEELVCLSPCGDSIPMRSPRHKLSSDTKTPWRTHAAVPVRRKLRAFHLVRTRRSMSFAEFFVSRNVSCGGLGSNSRSAQLLEYLFPAWSAMPVQLDWPAVTDLMIRLGSRRWTRFSRII